MDNFIQAYNEHGEIRASVAIIIAVVVVTLLDAFPFLFWWLIGFSIAGMIATLAIYRYKRNQWRKEDA